jgi:hypothetical protein
MLILINVLSALQFTSSCAPDHECLPPKRPVGTSLAWIDRGWYPFFLSWSTCAADSIKIQVSGDKTQFVDGVHSLTVKGIEAICVGSKIYKNVSIDQSNHQYQHRYIWSTVCKKVYIYNKRKRIPKVYSNMDNPEKLTA